MSRTDRPAPPTAALRRARLATFAFFGLNGFVLGMWIVHIPVIEERTGVSHSTLGALLLVLGGAALASMQVAGPLSDRLGHRTVVTGAGILISAAVIAPGLATGPWALAAALVALGLGNGGLDVAMNAHAVEVERGYGRPVMSAFHAVFSVGSVAAAAVGAPLLAHQVAPGATLTVVAVVGVLAACLAGRGLLAELPPQQDAAGAPADAADTGAGTGRRPLGRALWLLGALTFALMLCEGVAYDWSTLHLRDVLDASVGTAALAYGAFSVAMTGGRFAADRVSALLGPVRVVRYGAAVAAVGLATAAASPWIAGALAGWTLFGIGLSGCVPQFFTAAGNLDPNASGAAIAKVGGLGYLGLLAGPAVIGALTHWMPLNAAFVLPVVLCVVGAASARVLRPAAARSQAAVAVESSAEA
ncbi:MFS transporter [Peterkaempfera bronchialis]|uniref:MFS transporter n=1 Tax=Peterkaempfera bronchialis TaxID=2126346 RepID=A0A345T4D8_9ACTN|nr:MFS transporter [Peterkaempfera bronchialis]AXI80843.1 MFS transporter [Peterkaempfera bronchialis]